ncbi:MAG: DUF2271 domain-containing protein [Pseudomonadota bacterium]|nr:DUF2271 domain-containing protein [Pseudomonadota bacterium]
MSHAPRAASRYVVRSFSIRPLLMQLMTLSGMGLMLPTAQAIPLNLGEQAKALTTPAASPAAVQSHRFHRDHVLGTSLDVVINSSSIALAEQAFVAIQQEIERLDQVLSIWRPDSEISQLNQADQRVVSEDLFTVIHACEQWRSQTCGAFSARMGQLLQHWERAQGVEPMTTAQRVQQAQQIQQANVVLDATQRLVQRPEAVHFAPDALAKGYVIDRALMKAREAAPSIAGILVDIGGDIRVWGQAPQAEGWKIGLRAANTRADNATVHEILNLNNQSVALSGRGARDGQHGQSHLIDPMTGQPLDQIEQTVVVAPQMMDADALATALAAMSPAQGMALVEQLAGVEAKWYASNGDAWHSAGWQSLVATADHSAQLRSVSSDAQATWPKGYRAVLDLEIPKITIAKYRAPYVVVWITDAQRQLVRTLQVWGNDPQWMDTNYVWWRRYGRKMENLDSVAKPSRKPGQYQLEWDGKDDAGKQLPAGQYTVHVEAVREHGEHSYHRFELVAAPKSSVQSKPAKDELGTLKLRFDRVI